MVLENRSIFITSLPSDTTVEELKFEFGRYGIIDTKNNGEPRIKLYYDEEGKFKGEALITYFKKDSVPLAIDMRDDSWFRPSNTNGNIRVQEADMSYKRHTDGEQVKHFMSRKEKKENERSKAEKNR